MGQDLSALDTEEVFALLQGHVDRGQKIGVGIKRIYVDAGPDHPNSTCFWIERVDGSVTDFGVPACLNDFGKINRMSLRELVKAQIGQYRQKRLAGGAGTFVSGLSGEVFPITEAHVDHRDVIFEEIVRQFCIQESLDLDRELLTISKDSCSTPQWRDQAVADRFASFHAGFPLQLISRQENLSTKKCRDNQRLRAKG
jgi:hypothetical protein